MTLGAEGEVVVVNYSLSLPSRITPRDYGETVGETTGLYGWYPDYLELFIDGVKQ